MEITWEDVENSIDGCVAICKKNGLTIFRIMESIYGFYADYSNNELFTSPNLTYLEAARIANNKMKKDSLDNRLIIAKEFFLEDYKEQISKKKAELLRISVHL